MKNTFKSLQENALLRVIPTMTFQDIYFTWIETSILTFNLAYILTFNLTYILTFYLTYILTRNLAFYLAQFFWQLIWHSIWHCIWHDILSKYNTIIESSDEQGLPQCASFYSILPSMPWSLFQSILQSIHP